MTGYRGKTVNKPREVVSVQAQNERESQWGEIPGKVVSFDAATQTATIQPLYKPKHNGEPVDMSQLMEVPVRFTRAGGFVITHPIKPGDKVNLRPQMRSSEQYHSGEDYTPDRDARSFALSDMEAFLDGGESLSEPIPNFNSTNMEIRSADGQFAMEMSEDGKFRMKGAMGDWFSLLADLADLFATHLTTDESGSWPHNKMGAAADIAAKLRGMAL